MANVLLDSNGGLSRELKSLLKELERIISKNTSLSMLITQFRMQAASEVLGAYEIELHLEFILKRVGLTDDRIWYLLKGKELRRIKRQKLLEENRTRSEITCNNVIGWRLPLDQPTNSQLSTIRVILKLPSLEDPAHAGFSTRAQTGDEDVSKIEVLVSHVYEEIIPFKNCGVMYVNLVIDVKKNKLVCLEGSVPKRLNFPG